jgi:hypothetical protein
MVNQCCGPRSTDEWKNREQFGHHRRQREGRGPSFTAQATRPLEKSPGRLSRPAWRASTSRAIRSRLPPRWERQSQWAERWTSTPPPSPQLPAPPPSFLQPFLPTHVHLTLGKGGEGPGAARRSSPAARRSLFHTVLPITSL